MRGVYSASATISSFTTGDIFSIEAPATESVELLEVHVEVQNPTAGEDLDISAHRCTVNPTGGTTVTPEPTEEADAAASSTVRQQPTGETQEAAAQIRRGFPVETGWHWTPTPEQRRYIQGGGAMVFKMNTTITSATLIFTLEFREIG